MDPNPIFLASFYKREIWAQTLAGKTSSEDEGRDGGASAGLAQTLVLVFHSHQTEKSE